MDRKSIDTILNDIKKKNPEIYYHSIRVAEYTRQIMILAGFSMEDQHTAYRMALMHDIGKLRIPDELLRKKEPLNEKEYYIWRQHPKYGYQIIQDYPELKFCEDSVLFHDEQFDGSGYPFHIKGEFIPLFVRIINIANEYDKIMASNLPEEKKRTVLEYFIENRSGKYDPEYIKYCKEIIA